VWFEATFPVLSWWFRKPWICVFTDLYTLLHCSSYYLLKSRKQISSSLLLLACLLSISILYDLNWIIFKNAFLFGFHNNILIFHLYTEISVQAECKTNKIFVLSGICQLLKNFTNSCCSKYSSFYLHAKFLAHALLLPIYDHSWQQRLGVVPCVVVNTQVKTQEFIYAIFFFARVESGFRRVEPKMYQPRLIHVCGDQVNHLPFLLGFAVKPFLSAYTSEYNWLKNNPHDCCNYLSIFLCCYVTCIFRFANTKISQWNALNELYLFVI